MELLRVATHSARPPAWQRARPQGSSGQLGVARTALQDKKTAPLPQRVRLDPSLRVARLRPALRISSASPPHPHPHRDVATERKGERGDARACPRWEGQTVRGHRPLPTQRQQRATVGKGPQ